MKRELTWELATGKPPIAEMRLEMVMVYYHNDLEEGFGVGLDQRTTDLEAVVQRAFNAYKLVWDEADEQKREQLLRGYAAQVEYAARHRQSVLDTYPAIVLIMNVIWLAFYTDMPIDEYNGPQFMWGAGAPLPGLEHAQK